MADKISAFYNGTIILLIIFIFLLIAMGSAVFYQVLHRPLPVFEARAANGQVMVLNAFDEPNMMSSTILRWAKKAAIASYTFDFVNTRRQANLAAKYYTEAGWKDYQESIARLFVDIAEKKIIINSVVSGPAVISNQGDLAGKGYLWRVQIPFLVTYQAAETISKRKYFVVMTIAKIPTTIDPIGIGIEQFVMR